MQLHVFVCPHGKVLSAGVWHSYIQGEWGLCGSTLSYSFAAWQCNLDGMWNNYVIYFGAE